MTTTITARASNRKSGLAVLSFALPALVVFAGLVATPVLADSMRKPKVGGPPVSGPSYGRPPVTTGKHFGGYFRSGHRFKNPKVRRSPDDGDLYRYRR